MKFTISLAALLLSTSAAFAGSLADPIVEPPVIVPPVVAPTWTGAYVGLLGAYALTGDWNPAGSTTATLSFDGYGYGGFIGYNYEMSSGIVLGAEADVIFGSYDWGTGTSFDATLFDLKARVGYAAGKALVYAAGGYTTGEFNGTNAAGWNAGVGVDYLVTDSIFVGAQYVYRDIKDDWGTPTWEATFGTIEARVGLKF